MLSINEQLLSIVGQIERRSHGSRENRPSPALYALGHTGSVLRAACRGRLRKDDGGRHLPPRRYQPRHVLSALRGQVRAARRAYRRGPGRGPPLEGTEAGALCQRPPANEDYYLLYLDDDAYARVAQRVVERGAEQMVPSIMEKTGLSHEDAYLLFVHNVQGNLAVNRLLGWRRGPEFAHAQKLLGAYSEGGLRAVSSRHDSRSSS